MPTAYFGPELDRVERNSALLASGGFAVELAAPQVATNILNHFEVRFQNPANGKLKRAAEKNTSAPVAPSTPHPRLESGVESLRAGLLGLPMLAGAPSRPTCV
jgi:hypothetical protein